MLALQQGFLHSKQILKSWFILFEEFEVQEAIFEVSLSSISIYIGETNVRISRMISETGQISWVIQSTQTQRYI